MLRMRLAIVCVTSDFVHKKISVGNAMWGAENFDRKKCVGEFSIPVASGITVIMIVMSS